MLPTSRKKTTSWNLVFICINTALALVGGVILVPIYLKFLPVALYGAWLATGNILFWLTAIDPGLSAILQQQIGFAYGKQDSKSIGELITGGIFISGLISLVVAAVGLALSNHFVEWINLPENLDGDLLVRAFSISVVGMSLSLFSYSLIAINQGLQSSIGIGTIHNAVSLLNIALPIVLLHRGYGLLALAIPSVFLGGSLTVCCALFLVWRVSREKIEISFSMGKVRYLAKTISYTFLGRASAVISNNIDLFFTNRFIGPESVVLLNLTRKAPDMSRMFIERPPAAFIPTVSHLIGTGDIEKAREVLLRLIRILLWLTGLFTGGFIAFNDDFVRLWVGGGFFAGQTTSLLIVAKFALFVLVSALGNLNFACGNIKGNSLSGLIQSVLFIPLIILGAKYLGLLGVVLAPLFSIMAVQGWYMPYAFSKILKLAASDYREVTGELANMAVIVAPITICSGFLRPLNWFQFILMTVSFGILYCFGLFLLSKNWRSETRNVCQRLRTKFKD